MMASTAPSPKSKKDEKYYPSLYLDWDDKYDLPDSGEMTIRFVKNSETNSKRKGDSKAHQSVSLDITDILSVTDKQSKKSEKTDAESTEEALDKLKEEADENKAEEGAEGETD